MLLGYFIHMRPSIRLNSALCLLLPAASALLCGSVTNHAYESTGGARYLFLDNIALLPVILSSLCIFLLFKQIPFSSRAARIIHKLGAASFGIYLLADLFIQLLFPLRSVLHAHLPAFLAVLLYQIAVWFVSLISALALRHVPLLKQLL